MNTVGTGSNSNGAINLNELLQQLTNLSNGVVQPGPALQPYSRISSGFYDQARSDIDTIRGLGSFGPYGNPDLDGDGFISQTELANYLQKMNSDREQAMTVYQEMEAEQKKQRAQRWKIIEETKTKIFEIQQEVAVNQAKTQDKEFNKWSDYIRS